ncbi:MAG: hypothetical protein K9K66_02785 [Desulfarculaceae bacterium]|nr:hypothetical protein [Desulfarculaceae bacterium]MCF8070974.1 hypothetical protein [Desulfarculaceae bacterium]MCF8100562.1 hypothetical protein [Desulfarculaceae bacterium]MCF8116588.1 hypothetical protein [Desulfarculaceae bacterium]
MSKQPIDLSKLKLSDLDMRPSKVAAGMLGKPWQPGGSLNQFVASLPKVLAADDLRAAAGAVIAARKADKPVILGMGAHVIKVGLSPLIIDAMERGFITGLAFNGAGVVHDTEMALAGRTSEDVAEALADGSFGTARQTGEFINAAIAADPGAGLGLAAGRALTEADPACVSVSLLAAAARLGLPATVHVSIGADIIHMHPSFDGAATGQASHVDFRRFTAEVAELKGGVFFNVGSAVMLPEVFLKAISAARNLGHEVKDFTTINLDMIRHYRPMTNVVTRPVLTGGRGISITGHHEINLPLLLAMVAEGMAV